MSDTLNCENCERKLTNRFFDKCMYCGHEIPSSARLSSEDKAEENERRAALLSEQNSKHVAFMEKSKEFLRKRGGTGTDPDTGGDCGDCGGD